MNQDSQILASLPQATIDRLPDPNEPGLGHCNRRPKIQFDKIALINEGKSTVIVIKSFNDDLQFTFAFADWERNPALAQGSVYPCTPWNNYDEVRLIADRKRVWTRTKHAAEDAYAEKDRATVYSRFTTSADDADEDLGPYDPTKHVIIPKGWDHAHCSMCWHTISEYCENEGDQWGFVSDGEWLCAECHDKYIVLGSLDFLRDKE